MKNYISRFTGFERGSEEQQQQQKTTLTAKKYKTITEWLHERWNFIYSMCAFFACPLYDKEKVALSKIKKYEEIEESVRSRERALKVNQKKLWQMNKEARIILCVWFFAP